MNAIETLSNEHGLIRQYLDNLELAARKIEDGQRPPREFFDRAVEFARTFVDKFHHFKEEHVMFMRLAAKHDGQLDGQLDTLRYEHERGRSLVSGMAQAISGYAEGDARKTGALLENAAAYVALLRHHIHVEDHVFYPLSAKTMTAEDMGALENEFGKARERHGERAFEENHKLVIDMGSMLIHL